MFHLIVTIAPKTSDDVVPVFDALSRRRALCLSEPGCLHWEAYQSLDSPQEFVLVEHWRAAPMGICRPSRTSTCRKYSRASPGSPAHRSHWDTPHDLPLTGSGRMSRFTVI